MARVGGKEAAAEPPVTTLHRPGQHPLSGLRNGGGSGKNMGRGYPSSATNGGGGGGIFPGRVTQQHEGRREPEALPAPLALQAGWEAGKVA